MFTRKENSKIFPKFLVAKSHIFWLEKIIVFSLSHLLICKEPEVGPYGIGKREEEFWITLTKSSR
jgi:hypothetical protein